MLEQGVGRLGLVVQAGVVQRGPPRGVARIDEAGDVGIEPRGHLGKGRVEDPPARPVEEQPTPVQQGAQCLGAAVPSAKVDCGPPKPVPGKGVRTMLQQDLDNGHPAPSAGHLHERGSAGSKEPLRCACLLACPHERTMRAVIRRQGSRELTYLR